MGSYSTNALLQIVSIMSVLVVVGFATARHYMARHKQAQGVLWLQAMRTLVTHIQRHRGLSAGYLSGMTTLKEDVESVQRQVSQDFEQISSVGEWIREHPEWQSITQHWARLAGNLANLPAARSMDQHTRLIKNILTLVDEIAAQHYLGVQTAPRLGSWRDLLALAELIGQVRAVGTAICAQHEHWETHFFNGAAKDLLSLTQEVFATLETPRCRHSLSPQLFQEVLDLLAYVDTYVLSEGPLISAPVFYQRVTETIDVLYTQFDSALTAVNRRANLRTTEV